MERKHYVRVSEDVYVDQWGPPPPDWARLLTTAIGVFMLAVMLNVGYCTFMHYIISGYRASCQSNLKQLGLALMQYEQDYDEHFPPVAGANHATSQQAYGWADALSPYLEFQSTYHCPAIGYSLTAPPTSRNCTDYWYNRHLSGMAIKQINIPTVTIVSGDGNDGTDQTDARYSLSALPPDWLTDESKPSFRHQGSANYLFADGHVSSYRPRDIRDVEATFEVPKWHVKREH